MDFESFQYIALLCVGTFFALSPLSWAAHRDAAKAEARKLAVAIRTAIADHLTEGPGTGDQVEDQIAAEMAKTPLRISTKRTFLLHVSHLLFVAFSAHLIVSFIIFAASGQGKTHVHESYSYATWFGVAYLVSVIAYMCVEETYRWVFSFATGGQIGGE